MPPFYLAMKESDDPRLNVNAPDKGHQPESLNDDGRDSPISYPPKTIAIRELFDNCCSQKPFLLNRHCSLFEQNVNASNHRCG